jgi:parallel beta-helix repeat protein
VNIKKIFLLASVLTLLSTTVIAGYIKPVVAQGIIYIRFDGSVDPDAAPILTVDNITYTFTDNVVNQTIVVQRDDIVIDGAGYILQGARDTYVGIELSHRSNVTIKNIQIKEYIRAIFVYESRNNTISGCTLTKNGEAIVMDNSGENKIIGNTISRNYNDGISIYSVSDNNLIVNNTITTDWKESYSFVIVGENNVIYHNNIIHYPWKGSLIPYFPVYVPYLPAYNQWDNGLEGNYWSDYNGTDANEDVIGDTPYIIDDTNQDRYPLMNLLTEAPDTVPPTADVGENKTVAENTSVEFDGSNSYDNVGVIRYEWDFGDGTTGIGMTISHTYVQIGNYTVTLKVKDGKNSSDSTSIIIEVLIDTDGDGTADEFDTDDDGDGMPDGWEIENELNPLDSSDKNQDPDGDWFSNIEEYKWGMNPRIYNPWKIYFATAVVAMVIAIPLTIIVTSSLCRKKREIKKMNKASSQQRIRS